MDKTMEQLEALLELKQKVVLEESPRFATQKPNTAWNYETFLHQLWWFLAITGDYQSMVLILLPHPCADYTRPSCSAESLRSFIQHRFATSLSPLLSSQEKPVLDIYDRPILAEGTIHNYIWLQSAYAAVTSLHLNREQTCSYVPACKKCAVIFNRKRHKSCGLNHHYQRFSNLGCPTTSPMILNQKKWLVGESVFPNDVRAFGDTPTPPTGTPNDPAPPDETEDLGISYAELYTWLSARLLKNCQFGHLASFGLHTMCRTFYFFCYLAIAMHTADSTGDSEDVQREARHADKETSRKYSKDALAALAQEIQKDPVLSAKQPSWGYEAALIAGEGGGLRRLKQFNPTNKVLGLLPEAAAFFVEIMLGVPPTSTQYRNPGGTRST
jgi:hypothetical protein